jgi:hypothetical protein
VAIAKVVVVEQCLNLLLHDFAVAMNEMPPAAVVVESTLQALQALHAHDLMRDAHS